MTIPEMFDVIDTHIKHWHIDEIAALRRHDDRHARECRLRIAALEQLAIDLRGKAAA